jgi:hypothetical protein
MINSIPFKLVPSRCCQRVVRFPPPSLRLRAHQASSQVLHVDRSQPLASPLAAPAADSWICACSTRARDLVRLVSRLGCS